MRISNMQTMRNRAREAAWRACAAAQAAAGKAASARATREKNPLEREGGQATAEIVVTCALCLAICAALIAFKDGFADGVHNGALAISDMFSGLHGGAMNTTRLK